ncbi:11389_t:CDS:1, partial [Diversispora eburnea]
DKKIQSNNSPIIPVTSSPVNSTLSRKIRKTTISKLPVQMSQNIKQK